MQKKLLHLFTLLCCAGLYARAESKDLHDHPGKAPSSYFISEVLSPMAIGPNSTSFSPTSGTPGSTFVITGENYNNNIDEITINGITASYVQTSSTKLTVTVPCNATDGVVKVNYTGAWLSDNLDSYNVTAITAPTLTVTAGSLATCAGTAVTLSSSGSAAASVWYKDGLITVTAKTISPTTAGSYTCKLISNGCTSVASAAKVVTVTALPAKPMVYSSATVLCAGGSATLKAEKCVVSTYAGSGTFGTAAGSLTTGELGHPACLAFDNSGNLLVTDAANGLIKLVSATDISTFAGSTQGFRDGNYTASQFINPVFICTDGGANIYVSDLQDNRIRRLNNGATYSIGTQTAGDINGASPSFNQPYGLACDASANLYIADAGNNQIKKWNGTTLSVFAGSATPGFQNGTGIAAKFAKPTALTFDASGNLYVADNGNYAIRKITSAGVVSTLAGGSEGSNDGTGITAQFGAVYGIKADASGNIYVLENNCRIRKITSAGVVSTLIDAEEGYADGGGYSAKFISTRGITLDAAGNIYVSDINNSRIRKISQLEAVTGYRWSNSSGATSINVTAAGSYTLQSVANGCTSAASDPVVITVSTMPATPVITAGGSTSFCEGGSVVLTSSATTGNIWNTGETTRSITASAGSYYVTAVNGACTTGASNVIEVSERIVTPPTIQSTNRTYICSYGETTILTASSSEAYLWSNGATTQYIYPATAGAYSVRAISQGCTSQPSVAVLCTLGTFSNPVISASGPVSFCLGDSVTLTSSIGSANIWSNGSYANSIKVKASGTYYLRNYITGCTTVGTSVTVTASLLTKPTVSASGPLSYCGNGSVTLTSSSTSGNVWSTGEQTRSITVNASGSYKVKLVSGTCSSDYSEPVQFAVNSVAAPELSTYGNLICNGDSSTIFTDVIADEYLWSNNARTRFMKTGDEGNYTLRTVIGGCTSAVSSALNVDLGTVNYPVITASAMSFCNGGSVTLTSSVPQYNVWSTGERTRTITVSDTVTRTVKIVSVCTGYPSLPIKIAKSEVSTPVISANGPTSLCGSGTVTLTSSLPTGNLWSNYATSQSITVSAAGSYSVTNVSGACTSAVSNVIDFYTNRAPASPMLNHTGTVATCPGYVLTAAQPANVSVFAGLEYVYGEADGTGADARFTDARYIAKDASGNIYITERTHNTIRKITAAGVVSTIAGAAQQGYINGSLSTARFYQPQGMVFDASGNLFVAEQGNRVIRKITPAGIVSTFAGSNTYGNSNGTGTAASFGGPSAMAMDAAGNIYVADFWFNQIRKITPSGVVTTFAGTGNSGSANGPALGATFDVISAMAFDASGNLYLCDQNNHLVRKISTDGIVSTIAGSTEGFANGMASSAKFSYPLGILTDAQNNLYVSESGNKCIRKIAPSGMVTTVIGSVLQGAPENTVMFDPGNMISDASGSLTFSDYYTIKKATSFFDQKTYLWSDGTIGQNLTVTQPGSYSAMAVSNGCTSAASAVTTVSFSTPRVPEISASDTVVCSGGTVYLQSSFADGNIWSNGATTQGIIVAAGTYTVKHVSDVCTSNTSLPVVIINRAVPDMPGSISGHTAVSTGSVHTYTIAPVPGAVDYTWVAEGDAVIVSSGTSAEITMGIYDFDLYVTANNACGSSLTSSTSIIITTANPGLTDLAVSSTQAISGAYNNVTITGTPTITLSGNLDITGNITVPDGATFITGCNTVGGSGSFTLQSGGTLKICNADGIANSGSAGAVQTATRSFSNDANYEYNGTAAQITGSGLPSKVRNLVINNAAGVSLSNASSVTRILALEIGNFSTNDRLTLLSNASGTAMAVNTNGTSSGNTKVQRWITATINSGTGYRHYASPVSGQALAGLTTTSGGFTPLLNTNYNTAAVPGSVTPFPNVFTFDESRINTASDTFAKGWIVPTGNMQTGRGYSVNIGADQTLQVSGPLNNGNQQVTYTGGNANNSGWLLAGNPYPAPIDWNTMNLSNQFENAVYTAQSTGQYAGRYGSYVNGVANNGGSRYIAGMQGFFMRANLDCSGTLTFTNNNRLTAYMNPNFYRTESAQGLVRLQISAAGSVNDETVIYFENGAFAGFDKDKDAGKVHAGGMSIYSMNNNEHYSINCLPIERLASAETRVPLAYAAMAAETHTISALESEGDWFVFDRLDNRMHEMPYSFTSAKGRFESRLELVRTNSVTGINKTAQQLSLYPNPTSGRLQLVLPGQSLICIFDAAGRAVLQTEMNDMSTLDLSCLPAGVFTLRCISNGQASVHKVVKQ
ncbi:MAG: T9SS type A sorting domain-containing protein [Bacteroidota bacterium]